jgi:hypothetical protein
MKPCGLFLESPGFIYQPWRDFTTWRCIATLKRIEQVVRACAFTGKQAYII